MTAIVDIKFEIMQKKEVHNWTWTQIANWVNEEYPGIGKNGGNTTSESLRTYYRQHWTSSKDARDEVGVIEKTTTMQNGTMFVTGVAPLSRYHNTKENVNKKGWRSINQFLSIEGAELTLMPTRAHEKQLRNQPMGYDKYIDPNLFVTDHTINDNLQCVDLHLNPQQVDPLTGAHHLTGHKYGYMFEKETPEIGKLMKKSRRSLIIAHSKQMLQTLPLGLNLHPRTLSSTGLISMPQYRNTAPGVKAESWHVLGGLVIDIMGDKFWQRQVQINPHNGEFVDLGYRYFPNKKPAWERAEVLSVADPHVGWHCPKGEQALHEMIEHFQPRIITLEDVGDGASVRIFDKNKGISPLRKPKVFSSMESEGQAIHDFICRIEKHAPSDCRIIIKQSNHHKFWQFYLDGLFTGRRPKDCDVEISLLLGACWNRGYDPFRVLVDHGHDDIAKVLIEGLQSRWEWMEPGQDLFIDGIQNAAHTDEGINKRKGTAQDAVKAYGYVTGGHGHMPCIINGLYRNGTMKIPGKSYDQGQPRVWMQSHTVQYRGAHRQLITVVDGHFKGER